MKKQELQMANEIIELLNQLNEYYNKDFLVALNKSRIIAEAICQKIILLEKIRIKKTDNSLNIKINKLKNLKIIPSNIIIHLRTIQNYGNMGSHYQGPETKITSNMVKQCILALSDIIEWFFDKYDIKIKNKIVDDKENIEVEFKNFQEIKSNISLNQYILHKSSLELARLAACCPTFEGAQNLLKRIDENDLIDPDLISYIIHCKNLVDFCIKVGIPRSSNTHFKSILKNISKPKIIKALLLNPISTISEGFKLKDEMKNYFKLDNLLSKRYNDATF